MTVAARDVKIAEEFGFGKGDAMQSPRRLSVEWIDVVFVVLGVVILLVMTMELWLPHRW